jgi:hypothetical protein
MLDKQTFSEIDQVGELLLAALALMVPVVTLVLILTA